MKAAGIVLLSIGLAASLCGCAVKPVNAVDPNRYHSMGVYDPRNTAFQRERWLNGAGLNGPSETSGKP